MTGKLNRISAPNSLLLTIGFATVYTVIFFWVIAIGEGFISSQEGKVYESVVVTIDGEPIIQRNEFIMGAWQTSYLNLEREVLEIDSREPMLEGAAISLPNREAEYWRKNTRRLGIESFRGKERLKSYWYFVAPEEVETVGYFVNYDPLSKRVVRYLGKNGFVDLEPAIEDQFAFDRPFARFFQDKLILGAGANYWTGPYPSIPVGQTTSVVGQYEFFHDNAVLATADNKLLTINFNTGEISSFYDEEPVLSVSQLSLSKFQLPEEKEEMEYSNEYGMLMRLADRVLWYGMASEQKLDVKIPETLVDNFTTIHFLPNGNCLYAVTRLGEEPNRSIIDLVWADKEGNVLREMKEVVKTPHQGGGIEIVSMTFMLAQPSPVFFAATAPFVMSQATMNQYGASPEQVKQRILPYYLGGLCILLLIAVFFLWLAMSREKARSNRRLDWWEYVLLLMFGPFAFLAIMLNRVPLKLESLPPLVAGVEIFSDRPADVEPA